MLPICLSVFRLRAVEFTIYFRVAALVKLASPALIPIRITILAVKNGTKISGPKFLVESLVQYGC